MPLWLDIGGIQFYPWPSICFRSITQKFFLSKSFEMYVQGQSPDKEGQVRLWTLPYFRSVVMAVYFSWKGGHPCISDTFCYLDSCFHVYLAGRNLGKNNHIFCYSSKFNVNLEILTNKTICDIREWFIKTWLS